MPEATFPVIEFVVETHRAEPRRSHEHSPHTDWSNVEPVDFGFKNAMPNAIRKAWLDEESFATGYLTLCDRALKSQGVQPPGTFYLHGAQTALMAARIANEVPNATLSTCSDLARRGCPSPTSVQRIIDEVFDTLWHYDEFDLLNLSLKSEASRLNLRSRLPPAGYMQVLDLAKNLGLHRPGRPLDATVMARKDRKPASRDPFGLS